MKKGEIESKSCKGGGKNNASKKKRPAKNKRKAREPCYLRKRKLVEPLISAWTLRNAENSKRGGVIEQSKTEERSFFLKKKKMKIIKKASLWLFENAVELTQQPEDPLSGQPTVSFIKFSFWGFCRN